MLLQMDGNCPSGRSSAIPGILDSPTLARVERAMLRHEEGAHRETALLQRQAFTQVCYLLLFYSTLTRIYLTLLNLRNVL